MIEIKRKKQAAESHPERAQQPAEALDAQATQDTAQGTESALKGQLQPFRGIDEKRDYRAMYRAAFMFHEKYSPPQIDLDYWRACTTDEAEAPRTDLDYWDKVTGELCEVSSRFNNDRFMKDLLIAIYNELEREYKAMRQTANNPC